MMTMVRQVWLMLFGILLFAWVGSVATYTLVARQSLNAQLQLRNSDAALMLAQALSQHNGDVELMRQTAAAQLDAGRYRRLRLLRDDGGLLFERGHAQPAGAAPAWFAQLLPVDALPGVATVFNGARLFGTLQVSSPVAWASDELWDGFVRMASWLSALWLVAMALAALALRAWRQPLQAAVAQAQSLQERRFVIAGESRVPELQRLTRSMNSLVLRLQGVFESQAAQLDELRAQAHLDPVTGVLRRRQFVAQLGAALGAESQRGAGLLLVRLRRLDAMNRRIGREATDQLLAALAQVLQSYPRHVKGALAGRLNGADFALYLPASGMAVETARSLVEALRAALATVDQGAELVIGGIELTQPVGAANAMSMADVALAQAESSGPFAVEVRACATADGAVLGQQQWHARLADAMRAGRMQLTELPMRGPNGALLHLDCRTGLQLDADGPFEPASKWMAMAVRCRLVASVDLAALDLALAALKRDGLPRCIDIATASLGDAGFVDEVQQRLQAAPDEASLIGFDFVEAASLQAKQLQRASVLWRRCGARIGLEHTGANLRDLSRLHAMGVDYVKIAGAFVQGAAQSPAVRELARGLVTLLHDMDLQVLAEAVSDPADLSVLWAAGFDGASEAALRVEQP